MKAKKILSWLVLVVLIIIGTVFLKNNLNELKNVFNVHMGFVFLILLTVLLRTIFNGLKLKILIGLYGIKLKAKEWFGLQIGSILGNYLIPLKGGVSLRSIYLKKKYNFKYTYSVGIVGMASLVDILVLGILGFVFSLFFPLIGFKYGLIYFFGIISLVSIYFLFFLPLPIKWNVKLLKHVANSISEFRRLRGESKLLFKIVLLSLGRLFTNAFAFYFAFLAYGFAPTFYECIMMRIMVALSLIVSITPMNLGVQEALIVISSGIIGSDVMTGAFVAALYRATSIVFVFIVGSVFSFILLKSMKKKVR